METSHRVDEINRLRVEQSGGNFADDIFKRIVGKRVFVFWLNFHCRLFIYVPVYNSWALVRVVACRRKRYAAEGFKTAYVASLA